jgi:hypothetical protein
LSFERKKMAAAVVSQENVVASLVSRTGRHLQRYNKGRRQVVGWVALSLPPFFSTEFFFLPCGA